MLFLLFPDRHTKCNKQKILYTDNQEDKWTRRLHMYIHTHIYVRVYTDIYTHITMYIHVCIHMSIHICIHTYIICVYTQMCLHELLIFPINHCICCCFIRDLPVFYLYIVFWFSLCFTGACALHNCLCDEGFMRTCSWRSCVNMCRRWASFCEAVQFDSECCAVLQSACGVAALGVSAVRGATVSPVLQNSYMN